MNADKTYATYHAQMQRFVIDVLNTSTATPGVQSTPYGKWLGQDGNHVGLILFNDTVRSKLVSNKSMHRLSTRLFGRFSHQNRQRLLRR